MLIALILIPLSVIGSIWTTGWFWFRVCATSIIAAAIFKYLVEEIDDEWI